MGSAPTTTRRMAARSWAACCLAAVAFIFILHRSKSSGPQRRWQPEPWHDSWSEHLSHKSVATGCTPRESDIQAWHFAEHRTGITRYLACGAGAWMRKYQQLSAEVPKLLIDIGGNKGYMAGELFSIFAPELNFSAQRVYKHIMQQQPPPDMPCGACNDCQLNFDTRPVPAEPSPPLVVHSFEPSRVHFPTLKKLHKAIFAEAPQRFQWEIHNQAVSNVSGEIGFPTDCATELCHITPGGNLSIPVTTVDDFVKALPGSSDSAFLIDILKIDTEGFDPAVLQGARRVLETQSAALVYFEYNAHNLWAETTLKSVVSELEALNYVCYFEGRPTLTRITGCWDDRFEFQSWSNVVCTPQTHWMLPVLEGLSFRAFC